MPSNGFKRDANGNRVTFYLINDQGRECARCDQFKPWDQYHKKDDGAYQRDAVCKTCKKHKVKSKNKQDNQQEPMAQSMTGGFKLFLVDRVHLQQSGEMK